MNRLIVFAAFSVLLSFFSCKGAADNDETIIDTLGVDTSLVDTLALANIPTVDSAGYSDEEVVLTKEIERKYGLQWDFCDCVVKNDSINKALNTTDDNRQVDLIILRMEVIDSHCVEMLTFPNTTPEERTRHERKVNKCLKAANK